MKNLDHPAPIQIAKHAWYRLAGYDKVCKSLMMVSSHDARILMMLKDAYYVHVVAPLSQQRY
jgi:hypothetical protein